MISSLTPIELLSTWLQEKAEPEKVQWLLEKSEAVIDGDLMALYLSFGQAPRKFGKADLNLDQEALQQAQLARASWDPSHWTIDQTARTLLLMAVPGASASDYVPKLDRLFETGELGELVALYQALPLLPYGEDLVKRAAEGLRTNMKPVFAAVAQRNPYPEEYFSDDTWNQMILKALFIGVSLDPIVGIDRRVNLELARMLIDYAHERLSAHRPIPVELWRVVAPFANEMALNDMEKLLNEGKPLEQQAVALALADSATDRGDTILSSHSSLAEQVELGQITWQQISQAAQSLSQ